MKFKLTQKLFQSRKEPLKFIMRTFILLFCTAAFSFSPIDIISQNAEIKIDSDRVVTVDEVFDLIMSQTDYVFMYQVDMFKNFPKVILKKGTIKANELLNKSLSPSNFSFNMSNDKQTITIKETKSLQQITITGTVKDINGVPLPGITVYVSNNEPKREEVNKDFIFRGTSTDIDGQFKLIGEVGYYIVAYGLGYEFKYEQVSASKTIYNIILKEHLSALDEVVIVGYGETKRKDLTGSVGSVDAEEIQQIKSQSIDQALAGKISGVYVQGQGGRPGSGAIVNIRGLSAIKGDNQPLYVIDGIPVVVNPVFNSETLATNRENPLLAINPADIERVDVLKDASSAAIYGSRAANGVILITTKRGKRNTKPQFSFSVNSTLQVPIDTYDVFDASEYKDFVTASALSRIDNGTGTPTDNQIVNDPNSFFGNENTDWQKKSTNNMAMWYDYRVGFSGGTENTNYLVSANITDQDGLFLGGKYNGYNLAFNIDSQITDSFKVGSSINYNYTVNNYSGIASLEQVSTFRPDVGVYDENGEYTTSPFFQSFSVRNPVGGVAKSKNKRTAQNMYANIYGELNIIDGLKFKSQVNVAANSSEIENFSPSFSFEAVLNLLNGGTQEASLYNQFGKGYTTVFSNTLNYNKTFGSHSIDAVLGVSWDKSRQDLKAQEYFGFPDDYILTNVGNANRVDNFSSESIESGLNSQFARVNYNFKDIWLATFTARRDGSTKFGTNNQYGFFPSGALAWNLHNESFMKDKFVNKLKLRGSIGKTGSDNLSSFSYLAYFNSGNFYANENGTAVNGIPNLDIKWEETDQIDLGLEFGLFNSRIYGEVVYFEKNTSGIILFTPIPTETGFTSFNANVADVSNKGWEIGFGAEIIRNDKFRWTSEINVSFIKNNVDNLNSGTYFNSGSNTIGLQEGQPMGVILGYDVIGIAQTPEEIDALNSGAPDGSYFASLQQPGDYIFKDVNGDGEISDDDIVPLGSILPDYFGGWNNTLSYGNFDLGLNLQFVKGNSREVGGLMSTFLSNTNPYNNTTSVVYDTWSPDNRDATYGRLGAPTSAGVSWISKFVEDASYIRLKTLSLGYNIPHKLLDNYGINSARLSLMANNLFTISNYPGIDPESVDTPRQGSGSFDLIRDQGGSYPLLKTFSFGVNISF